jgi:transcriptional regulator with XRE-family HTH domain
VTDLHTLIAARELIHASQHDVGEALGVSRSWVAKLECGEAMLTPSRARRYAEALAAIQNQRSQILREVLA